jgi:cobyrinic acid a,c-diamide synthase
VKGFVIAGTNSGVGKTTISIGIMEALRKRGLKIAPFKVGPDYIDPAFHKYVCNEYSYNLDEVMLEKNTVKYIFRKHSEKKDIAVVEGVMGLYDGLNFLKENGSTAQLSKTLGLPIILIVNPKGMGASIIAHIKGYADYDKEINISGIILNQTSEGLYKYYKNPIEEKLGIKCIGYIPKEKNISLGSRYLGLIPACETKGLDKKIKKLGNIIENHIDLNYLSNLEIKKDITEDEYQIEGEIEELKKYGKGLKIGYAYDPAFNFYYKDNLELLEKIGVELTRFSPLKDREISKDYHGIYLGGGFPEIFAEKLSRNSSFKKSLKDRLNEGMFAYGECGGFMYLCKEIKGFEGRKYEMVNFFNLDVEMTKSLNRFGYVQIKPKWKEAIKGHEFHRSKVTETRKDHMIDFTYEVSKLRTPDKKWMEGYRKNNVLAGYPHIHFFSNLKFLKEMLKKIKEGAQ